MSWKLRAVAAAALLGAGRLGASAFAGTVPTISVMDLPTAGSVAQASTVTLALPARPVPGEPAEAPRFTVSTTALADHVGIAVPGISSAPSSARVAPAAAHQNVDALATGSPRPGPAHEGAAETAADSSVSFSVPRYSATRFERETIAACLVLEAASQGEFGMRAVMAVIRNRARGKPELFVPTVLRAKQFSALNRVTAGYESLAAAVRRARRDCMWPLALDLVDRARDDSWADPTDGATHYTRSGERTRWTRSLAKTTTIGAHSFYR